VTELETPPLCECREDIPLIAASILERIARQHSAQPPATLEALSLTVCAVAKAQ